MLPRTGWGAGQIALRHNSITESWLAAAYVGWTGLAAVSPLGVSPNA